MPEILDKIKEKARKLHNHAQSASQIGSEAEAQSFMERLLKLMAEYKLEMSDIAEKETPVIKMLWRPEDYGIEIKSQTECPDWLYMLAVQVGKTTGCAISGIIDKNWLFIHGTEVDIQQCANALGYLGQCAMRLAMRSYREFLAELRARGINDTARYTKDYKNSFLLGFVCRIYERMEQARQKLDTGEQAGLVLLDKALTKAEESQQNQDIVLEPLKIPDRVHTLGYAEGVRVANEQPLRPAGELP